MHFNLIKTDLFGEINTERVGFAWKRTFYT